VIACAKGIERGTLGFGDAGRAYVSRRGEPEPGLPPVIVE
jgi:hypothetical protein